jgi:methylated-DNA-[protein]-cysteine S-methyltransferase
MVGGRHKARAVGGAAHANPLAIIIPCHRLIGAGGGLTGFGGGLPMKQALLELEGCTIRSMKKYN